jgi:hypothetical protein
MNWYKTAQTSKFSPAGFKTDKIPDLTRGQLLNVASMELLTDNPDRERIWQAVNSMTMFISDDPSWNMGNAIMGKVDGILTNTMKSQWENRRITREEAMERRQDARDLLMEIMNEFMGK